MRGPLKAISGNQSLDAETQRRREKQGDFPPSLCVSASNDESADLDKLHEECGVVAIFGHPEAAKLAYLGLYALQHRGQESAGICTAEGPVIHCHKSMGHVADIFTQPVLTTLPGESA